VKPEGATVEQTLVALHRHNPDAFIRKNMNLVRSGKILKVPEASEISALPQPEAVREVRLQFQDFNAFRNQVAERAPSAAEDGSATRGRIGSVVTDSAASEPRDTVRISKGEPPGRPAASAKGSAEERIRALEEEAVSRQRALAEAGERIGQLEKIIKDMQRLAELRTPGATPAQKAAEPPGAKPGLELKSSASVSGTIAPPRVEQSKAAAGGSASSAPVAETTAGGMGGAPSPDAKDAPVGPVAALPKTAPKPVPEPESSRSFMGGLLGQPLVLGLAAAVLLLALLWVAMRRRRARGGYHPDGDKIPPTFTGRSVVPPPAGGAQANPKAATAAAPPPRMPDALSTQAPGATVQPAAPIRSRNPATDNDLDFDLSPGGTGSARPAPVSLDAKPSAGASEPKKPDTTTVERPPPVVASPSPSVVPEPAKPQASTVAPADALGAASKVAPAAALGAALTASQAAAPSTDRSASGTGTRGPGQGPDAPLDAPAPSARSDAAAPKASSLIDFDLDAVSPERRTIDAISSERVSSEPPPRDFEFKLDLDNLDLSTPGEAKAAAPPKDAHWYDVQQKFDLAKAYEEMGDRNGARDILREVLKEGDQEQRVQATQLLAKLG
jgi:pilus assembly protein FimV